MTTFTSNLSLTDASSGPWGLKSGMLQSTVSTGSNWPVVASGNTVTWTPLGDVVTAQSMMLLPRTWWVVRGHPYWDGTGTYSQQLCFQVDGSGGVRVKVSPRVGFSNSGVYGGTPSASQVPSATDERVRLGGGTDASPTFASLFPTSGSWMQARYSESSDALWAMCYPSAGGAATALFFVEPVAPQWVNGVLVDKAPWVYGADTGTSCALASHLASEVYGPMGVLAYGVTASSVAQDAWVRLPAGMPAVIYDTSAALQVSLPGGLPQDPSILSSPVYPQGVPRCGRRGVLAGTSTGANESGNLNTVGDKGDLTTIRYSGNTFSTPTLLTGVNPTNGTPCQNLIGIGSVVLPWGGPANINGGA